MKRLALLSLLCLLYPGIRATETEKLVRSKPEKAIVYLQGAQLFRSASVTLPQGQSTIVFEGLEQAIDPQSIQATGTNCLITETQYLLHYPQIQKLKATNSGKYAKSLKLLDDSLVLLGYDAETISSQRQTLELEKNVLLSYGLYKGTSKKDSIGFLREGLAFLREKLNNINGELQKLKKEEAKVQAKIRSVETRKAQIESEENNRDVVTGQEPKPDYRIVITVMADAPGNASISINYFLSNAGWAPAYDIRSEGLNKPVQLTYKATVFQNSGNDWKDIRLTLSTANPKQSFNLPVLNPYFVDVYRNNLAKKAAKTATGSEAFNQSTTLSAPSFHSENLQNKNVVISPEEAYETVVMDDNLIQTEFEIKLSYSIPSDNKQHFVSILSKELKTSYVHKTIPKLDANVYLTARITDYEVLRMIPGKANVYMGGTFMGRTFIQTGSTEDTLELALGQDKNVTVQRKKIKDMSTEKVLDNDKIYDVAYEIVVKNNHSRSIDIEVLDQIPMAKSQQINIEKVELNGARQDAASGGITWRDTIKSGDTKKHQFRFKVKAPRNMNLVVK